MVFAVSWSQLILDFIVHVVEPVSIALVASPIDHNHWDFVVAFTLRVCDVLQYARALPKDTLHKDLLLFSLVICPSYAYVREDVLEKQVCYC